MKFRFSSRARRAYAFGAMTRQVLVVAVRILSDIPLPVRVAASLALFIVLGLPGQAKAQGEGPHTYFPAPDGTNILVFTYMDLKGNYDLSLPVQITDANVKANVLAPTYMRFFSAGGRLAELTVTGVVGHLSGSATVAGHTINAPSTTGLGDWYIGIRLGLAGAPALKMADYVKHKQGFQVYGILGVYIPASQYDSSKLLNVGTNRWTIRLGLPLVKPFGKPARPVTLEVVPNVNFYTANNNAQFGAKRKTQKPLFYVENHLSSNLTKKFWGSLDLRAYGGGKTTTDGVSDHNTIYNVGGGGTIGYAVTRAWGLQFTFGHSFYNNNGTSSRMYRVRTTYTF